MAAEQSQDPAGVMFPWTTSDDYSRWRTASSNSCDWADRTFWILVQGFAWRQQHTRCFQSMGVILADALVLPIFQRKYCWSVAQFSQLWRDIFHGMNTYHSLGKIILAPLDRQRWLVVDGQQRCTTVTILLACLRDALLMAARESPDQCHDGAVSATVRALNNMCFLDVAASESYDIEALEEGVAPACLRFSPTYFDREVYAKLLMLHGRSADDVLTEELKQSHQYVAYAWFSRAVQQRLKTCTDLAQKLQFVRDATYRVSTRLTCVSVQLETMKYVQQVFQYMFERGAITALMIKIKNPGVTVGLGDLTRNFLLSYFLLDDDLQERIYLEGWLRIERALPREQLDRFVEDVVKQEELTVEPAPMTPHELCVYATFANFVETVVAPLNDEGPSCQEAVAEYIHHLVSLAEAPTPWRVPPYKERQMRTFEDAEFKAPLPVHK